MKAISYRFELNCIGSAFDVHDKFFPQGNQVLNRTEWRGRPPRTCGITDARMRPWSEGLPVIFDVEVTYRPNDYVSFVGQTRYEGWTLTVVDKAKDGTLLDGKGGPLEKGKPPVYLRFEVYHDIEFNELDFGRLVAEQDTEEVGRVEYTEVWAEAIRSGKFSSGLTSNFTASHRHRPFVKIILTSLPSSISGSRGDRIVNISIATPRLAEVIFDQVAETVIGYLEGKYTLNNLSAEGWNFVIVDDLLVDCTPNEVGKPSRFHCLKEYVADGALEELAKRLSATFQVQVSVVQGEKTGFLFRPAVIR